MRLKTVTAIALFAVCVQAHATDPNDGFFSGPGKYVCTELECFKEPVSSSTGQALTNVTGVAIATDTIGSLGPLASPSFTDFVMAAALVRWQSSKNTTVMVERAMRVAAKLLEQCARQREDEEKAGVYLTIDPTKINCKDY